MTTYTSRPPPGKTILAGFAEERFVRLEELAASVAGQIPWGGRLEELSCEPVAVARALASPISAPPDEWARLFDPFEGLWVGGDIHDARRGYQHIWFPSSADGDLASQVVLMLASVDASRRAVRAYNFCRRVDGGVQIRGAVGDRAHVGFRVGEAGLLWVGEERDAWRTVHLERVVAGGRLYEVRGLSFKMEREQLVESTPSDWRYHRVNAGAIQVPAPAVRP